MRLTDVPRYIAPSVYEDTRKAIIEKYKNLPGVEAVVEWGTIPYPGVSDMDFHILIKPGSAPMLPKLSSYTKDQQYAMMHKHFAVSTEIFPLLHYFDPWLVHIDPIIGDSAKHGMPKKPFGEDEYNALSYHFMLVNGLLGFLGVIAEGLFDDVIPVREFFECSKYVEYHWKQVFHPANMVKPEETDEDIPLYRTLRSTWFDIPEGERLPRMEDAFHKWRASLRRQFAVLTKFFDTYVITVPVSDRFPPHNSHERTLLKKHPHSVIVDMGAALLVFERGRTKVELEQDTYFSPLKKESVHRRTFLLPLNLSAILHNHLQGKGPLSAHYRKHLVTDLQELPFFTHPALTKLIELMNRNIEDTKHVGRSKQPFVDYGLSISTGHSVPLRSRLNGIYDRTLRWLIESPMGGILRRAHKEAFL